MGRRLELTGKTFGEWFVEGFAFMRHGKSYWNCKCSCGNERAISGSELRKGKSKSCGKCDPKFAPGKRFGMLTLLSFLGKVNNNRKWLCQCDCGNQTERFETNLSSEYVTSCGCTDNKEHHGLCHTYEYKAWENLKHYYQGDLPKSWEKFSAFHADVGNRPTDEHLLAKHDIRKPHDKNNTYWRNRNDGSTLDQLTMPLNDECRISMYGAGRAITFERKADRTGTNQTDGVCPAIGQG